MSAVRDISDGVCAYLTGGLGNQLFIYAAAWEQAERLSCPLYVDISHYSMPNIRGFDLADLNLPGTIVSGDSPWIGKPLKFGRRRDRLKARLAHQFSTAGENVVFSEKGFNFDPLIFDIKVGTTISGYFQSASYFPTVGDQLRDAFSSVQVKPPARELIDFVCSGDHLVLHIRRGDYTDEAVRAHHGLASYDYFDRALALSSRLSGPLVPVIFTDDGRNVDQEFAEPRGINLLDRENQLSAISTLLAMSFGKSMIMSNSSFSWWAAWLMAGRRSENLPTDVIAPRPWFTAGSAAADLLQKNWVTLDAR